MTKGNQSVTVGYVPWDVMRNATERKLMAYPGAKMALKRLMSKGVGREHLLDKLMLLHMAKVEDSFSSYTRKKRTSLRGAPEGMTWEQFLRFPQQLEKMATTIDTINQSPYYDPSGWLYHPVAPDKGGRRDLVAELKAARANEGRLEANYFLQLPTWVRVYATFLQLVAKQVRQRTNRLKTVPRWLEYRDNLATYVHTHCKGQKCMADIAILISAVLGNEEGLDPETLRKQVYRLRRNPRPVKKLF